ncbi:MAG: hypothetical protein ABSB19_20435, partial [Methylomonas sp.]
MAECGDQADQNCINSFFSPGDKPEVIRGRIKADFPQYYLELYRPWARTAACVGSEDQHCLDRMERLAHFFNPQGTPAGENEIGVALEGGGTKSASFALGALAGLQEIGLLDSRVTAISSISGGSYAASYLYNRYFDLFSGATGAGALGEWFNSCIPDYFLLGEDQKHFDRLRDQALQHRCGEKSGSELKFADEYRYLGQVWTQHDLLLSSMDEALINSAYGKGAAFIRLSELLGETILLTPAQFLTRSLFRLPLNSSPSKYAYKLGLERAYGYTPGEWSKDKDNFAGIGLCERRSKRTLAAFADLLAKNPGRHVPHWIIGATAPGEIAADAWLTAEPRDPVRQQFEISWTGSGSGIYGYTHARLQKPTDLYDLFCPDVDSLPIVDAVVASAAFFDDEQLAVNQQPERLAFGIIQQFLDLTWFSELPNFNQGNSARDWTDWLFYPFYLHNLSRESGTANIHLQDGGNTDNSGIMPLLRRGYKTIIHVHGDQDTTAQWASICHVKNQLELDGNYYLVSPDFENFMQRQGLVYAFMQTSGRDFKSYLDGICSVQLDASDLAAFDDNRDNPDSKREKAVAGLYCGRLTPYEKKDAGQKERQEICPEFKEFYSFVKNSAGADLADNLSFYYWPSNQTMTFKIYTKNHAAAGGEDNRLLSTIIAVVPAVSWTDAAKQIEPFTDEHPVHDWRQWCEEDKSFRRRQTIKYCLGPDDHILSV